ncbi:hypothetical protein ACPWT1_20755 [Ramlibacter sp. MMS24-I3-19]|uniref:hypothetical protein n=1 Tax=Ramlibacter sp. MMS24-I3-19 TaxID=3416606 RepID=UPI003D03AD26
MPADSPSAVYVGAPEPQAMQRQPAGVLMSWLEQLLHKMVPPHTGCLLKVSRELGSLVYDRGAGKLADALRQTDAAVTELDYDVVLQPGSDPSEFRTAWQGAARGARRIAQLAIDVGTWLEANDQAVRRATIELRMDQQRLREVLAHADQWLADCWVDLRQRRPAEGDQAALEKLRSLAAKADALGARIRSLHSAGRAIEEACVLAEHVLTLRKALVQEVVDVLQPRHSAWEAAVLRMLEAADRADWAGDVGPAQDQDAALRVDLHRCTTGCDKLRQEENALQRCLVTACEHLGAAA